MKSIFTSVALLILGLSNVACGDLSDLNQSTTTYSASVYASSMVCSSVAGNSDKNQDGVPDQCAKGAVAKTDNASNSN